MSTSDKLTIKVDGVDRELFMSFGLLNDLTTIVSDPGRVAAIPLSPELRTEVLNAVLSERKPNGKLVTPADFTELDISVSDAEILIDWIAEHVMSFFVRALQKIDKVTKAHKGELDSLVSSFTGSNASPSATPSSGVSK